MENLSTSDFLAHLYEEFSNFNYVEIGMSDTFDIHDIAKVYKNAQLIFFDTHENIEEAKTNFLKYQNRTVYITQPNNIFDLTSFELARKHKEQAFIDYCVVNTSGTEEQDALAFFLIDTYVKTGGHIDFSTDIKIHNLINNYERYESIVDNKIYQKKF